MKERRFDRRLWIRRHGEYWSPGSRQVLAPRIPLAGVALSPPDYAAPWISITQELLAAAPGSSSCSTCKLQLAARVWHSCCTGASHARCRRVGKPTLLIFPLTKSSLLLLHEGQWLMKKTNTTLPFSHCSQPGNIGCKVYPAELCSTKHFHGLGQSLILIFSLYVPETEHVRSPITLSAKSYFMS